MFEFFIKDKELLNDFLRDLQTYVSKSYKFSMTYLSNPALSEYRENERLILIAVNKSVYQNLYSFLKLNDSHMQYAAFSCLDNAVYAMRLYYVLSLYPNYRHSFITDPGFSLETAEYEIAEKEEYDPNKEQFSLKEFYNGVRKVNNFEIKNALISSQLKDGNVFLGLSCGKELSDELQNEVRKNMIGAYLSLNKHTALFFNGGLDKELEEFEADLYAKFLEYLKKA